MINAWLLLGVAHGLGDYLLQPDGLARKKEKDLRFLLLHGLLYALAMGAMFLFGFSGPVWAAWGIAALSHLGIDLLRLRIARGKGRSALFQLLSFCLDQALHLGVLAGLWALLLRSHTAGALAAWSGTAWLRPVLVYGAIFCVIWKPAAILIRLFFAWFAPVAGEDPGAGATETQALPGSGELIGKLERLIIAVLVLRGQFGAIGFVLTAKSVARFKLIEQDRGFAERYLVGTLLSASIALLSALLGAKLL